jgi:predicted DNA-binding protein
MIRIHFFLPLKLVNKLRALAENEGVPVSEIVRRALAQFVA